MVNCSITTLPQWVSFSTHFTPCDILGYKEKNAHASSLKKKEQLYTSCPQNCTRASQGKVFGNIRWSASCFWFLRHSSCLVSLPKINRQKLYVTWNYAVSVADSQYILSALSLLFYVSKRQVKIKRTSIKFQNQLKWKPLLLTSLALRFISSH